MGKATRLYTKEIRGVEVIEAIEPARRGHFDHFPSWQGTLGPRFCRWVAELGDGRHREPRQASAVTPLTMFGKRCVRSIYAAVFVQHDLVILNNSLKSERFLN
jgi:hypothetical protein